MEKPLHFAILGLLLLNIVLVNSRTPLLALVGVYDAFFVWDELEI